MKLFKNKQEDFSENPLTEFEKIFLNPAEKGNPITKFASIILYSTVVIAVFACVFMAVLDLSGNTASVPSGSKESVENADVSAYPESLQKLYKENFEAADFVLSYFDEKDKVKEISLKEYKKSEQVPLFLQWDKQWGYLTYGDDLAGITGDGPLCLSMAGYYLTKDEKFSPDKIIEFANENGYYKAGKGTLATLMTDGAERLGLSGVQITPTSENIVAALQGGSPVICLMGPGNFTTTLQYVVIRGCGDGTLQINDPNSRINSEKNWLFTDISSQIKGIWKISKASL